MNRKPLKLGGRQNPAEAEASEENVAQKCAVTFSSVYV